MRASWLHAGGGPLLDPESRSQYSNEIIILHAMTDGGAGAAALFTVNGVKTIMVNDRLRTGGREVA
jgi:hypothetical protein